MKKFSEYTHSLSLPINLNLVKINPLRGTALFVLDPKLVFAIVDNFFGGIGRHAKIEGREFSATEMRVIHMLLRSAFSDMKEAWTPIADIDVEYVNSEINPNFAGIVTPSEVVVVCPFQIELEGGGGAAGFVRTAQAGMSGWGQGAGGQPGRPAGGSSAEAGGGPPGGGSPPFSQPGGALMPSGLGVAGLSGQGVVQMLEQRYGISPDVLYADVAASHFLGFMDQMLSRQRALAAGYFP